MTETTKMPDVIWAHGTKEWQDEQHHGGVRYIRADQVTAPDVAKAFYDGWMRCGIYHIDIDFENDEEKREVARRVLDYTSEAAPLAHPTPAIGLTDEQIIAIFEEHDALPADGAFDCDWTATIKAVRSLLGRTGAPAIGSDVPTLRQMGVSTEAIREMNAIDAEESASTEYERGLEDAAMICDARAQKFFRRQDHGLEFACKTVAEEIRAKKGGA